MVKEVVRWEAEDATVFNSQEEAVVYENELEFVGFLVEAFSFTPGPYHLNDFVEKYTKGRK